MNDNKCWTVRVALALGLFVALSSAQSPPTVTVAQGELVGTTETFEETEFIGVSKTIDVFKGIPFAEPPVGSLRFKAPVAKEPWDGTYNATYFRNACVQGPSQTFGAPESEDCLHLNIYAPRPAMQGGAAVMVWIHGGGFIGGSAVLAIYYGQPLVAVGDVIVVTINYRLNVFGFLTTSDEALPGNLGMRDQVLALQWIKENIGAFGGDVNRITIFGESAGSASVGFHILSEQSKGLFNQAVLQSGTVFSPWATFDDTEFLRRQAFQIGDRVGCTTQDSTALVNCLREKTETELFKNSGGDAFRSHVVVDGVFLTHKPATLYATGRYNHAKLLLGSNRDEGTSFVLYHSVFAQYYSSLTPPQITKETFDQILADDLSIIYGKSADDNVQLIDAINMFYTDWTVADYNNTDYFRTYVDYSTDSQFACGNDRVARVHAQAGDDVFLYQMTHVPSQSLVGADFGTGWLGAGHAEELFFMFGAPFIPDFQYVYPNTPAEEKVFSAKLMEFWTNFAKTGNPSMRTPGSQPETSQDMWPRFTVPELGYKVLDLDLTTSRALKSDQCYFWNNYILKLQTMLGELDTVQREWRQSFSTWKYTDMANWREEFAQYQATTMK